MNDTPETDKLTAPFHGKRITSCEVHTAWESCRLFERQRNEARRERDVFKLEMWKARNAVKTLAGATRHLLADFKGFKYAAKEIHDFGKSHGNYSIERAEKTLEKVRSLATVSVKGGSHE